MPDVKKVVIIGSGPAGHTAAVYAARANLNPFMFEGYIVGGPAGGQLTTTTDVENYPGFPDGINGPELMELFRKQAARFGTEMVREDVSEVDLSQRPFTVKSENRELKAHSIIIATGATAKRMFVPSEEKLWNNGMSACAVCDGALPFFRNQPLMVVGGGDTAVEEASYLTKFGTAVYMVHRRDQLRASKVMQKRAFDNPKIDIIWDTVLEDALGDEYVTGARIKNLKTNEVREIPLAGIFYAIGHTPNTAILGASIKLVKIADLDIKSDRGVPVASKVLTTDANEVLNHPEIDIVIELIGGIEPAKTFILKAIENGKHVVTANKALLAKHGDEIFSAIENGVVSIGYEASVAGSIPIIRSIREAFVAAKINEIVGIVNGTANYILSQMTNEGVEFQAALKEAQEKGFAEADPSFDIEGVDSAHKIAILTRLAYGTPVEFEDIYIQGITNITLEDIKCAHEFGYRIKLLAISKLHEESVEVRVHPAMIPLTNPLSKIEGSLNAVQVYDEWMEESVLVGHGAGSLPTGAAVLGDVVELGRGILSGAISRVPAQSFTKSGFKRIPIKNISEIESEYFLRFKVQDKPGVLSVISGILGEHSISIKSVLQRGRDEDGKGVPLILMTHQAGEKNIQGALKKINQQEIVCQKSILIRCVN